MRRPEGNCLFPHSKSLQVLKGLMLVTNRVLVLQEVPPFTALMSGRGVQPSDMAITASMLQRKQIYLWSMDTHFLLCVEGGHRGATL